jgi:hypothetical protein
MRFHIHPAAAETHALGLESEPLFEGRIAAELDFSARAEDALPGQPESITQDGRDSASSTRETCGSRHTPVR